MRYADKNVYNGATLLRSRNELESSSRNMLVPNESPLKNLPSRLDKRQALLFDGLAHAVDIVGIAYSRLRSTLHEIGEVGVAETELTAAVYLDSWSCIDAIDRFRSLLKGYKAGGIIPKDDPAFEAFLSVTEPVRKLRNVTDHVAARLDQLVSQNASVMGEISWISQGDGEKWHTWYIRPGIFKDQLKFNLLLPYAGAETETPTGFIHLTAGGVEVNLSAAVKELYIVLAHIETKLHERYKAMGTGYAPMPRYLLAKSELGVEGHEHTSE